MLERPAESARTRDTSRDGLGNTIEAYVLSHGRGFWSLVNKWPWMSRLVNAWLVNSAVLKASTRPLRLSTLSDYPSWSSLTDQTWFSRYLPPRDIPDLPPRDSLRALYTVRPSGPRLSDRSTLLFPSFAQWFTDGFLMTSASDRRRTTTNHQIDLSQIYGLNDTVRHALRVENPGQGSKGRLRSQMIDGEEFAPFLFDARGERVACFAAVPEPIKMPPSLPPAMKAAIFAFGGERANTTVFTAAVNTLFLREHNRLCGIIEAANPTWDDERVFQTARNISIVQLINIVVEEYINHISPYWFKLLSDPTPCYKAVWNRDNWIPVEFNLLYRWHSLVPETARWNGADIAMADTRFGNAPLLRDGLGVALEAASLSPVWRMGLFNTAAMLNDVELASVDQGRANRLASYNDYRELLKFPRVTRFEQISAETDVVAALKRLYGSVDRLEFVVGLFAEDPSPRSSVPPLIGRMVAVDAFSHALTNPLLSPHVFKESTFTREGWASIKATHSLRDIAQRNMPGDAGARHISMDQRGQASFA